MALNSHPPKVIHVLSWTVAVAMAGVFSITTGMAIKNKLASISAEGQITSNDSAQNTDTSAPKAPYYTADGEEEGASTEGKTCEKGALVAINNYPGNEVLKKIDVAKDKGLNETWLSKMNQASWQCSHVCVTGFDKKDYRSKANQDLIKNLFDGKTFKRDDGNSSVTMRTISTTQALDIINGNNAPDLANVIILDSLKSRCEGPNSTDYAKGGTKFGKTEIIERNPTNTVETSEQGTENPDSAGQRTDPQSIAAAPTGDARKGEGGNPVAEETGATIDIRVLGKVRLSSTSKTNEGIKVIVYVDKNQAKASGIGKCVITTTNNAGAYDLQFSVNKSWYNKNKGATLHFYAYQPGQDVKKEDTRNSYTTGHLNTNYAKLSDDGSTLTLDYTSKSAAGNKPPLDPEYLFANKDSGLAGPLYDGVGTNSVNQRWNEFKDNTGLDLKAVEQCIKLETLMDDSSVTASATQPTAAPVAAPQIPPADTTPATINITGKIFYGENKPSNKAIVCISAVAKTNVVGANKHFNVCLANANDGFFNTSFSIPRNEVNNYDKIAVYAVDPGVFLFAKAANALYVFNFDLSKYKWPQPTFDIKKIVLQDQYFENAKFIKIMSSKELKQKAISITGIDCLAESKSK